MELDATLNEFVNGLRDAVAAGALVKLTLSKPTATAGIEEKALGQAFIKSAAFMLRPGGVCWLVANRHLPYEALLNTHFSRNRLVVDDGGFKVFESVK